MSQSRRKPPKGSPKDGPTKIRPDLAETAYRVMMEATGQAPKTKPPGERGKDEKNPEAVKRGSKGGQSRRTNLDGDARTSIAKKAAQARWKGSATE